MDAHIVDWADGMSLGGGFDFLRSVIKGSAYEGVLDSNDTDAQPNPSQNVTAVLQKVESTQEFSNTMEVSADLSLGYGSYSGNVSASYLNSKKINKYSIFYAVSCNVIENTKMLLNNKFQLSTAAKALSKEDFRSSFGDYYVAGYKGGGAFTALMEIVTETDEEKTKIEQSLKADVDAGVKVGLTQKFADEINSINSTNTVNTTIFQNGGSGESVPIATVDLIQSRVESFPSQVKNFPAPIKAVLQPYTNLVDYPYSRSGNDYVIPFVEDQKQRLSTAYQNAKYYADCVFYVQQNPNQFDIPTKTLDHLYNALNDYMSTIFNARIDLDKDPTHPATIPVMPDVSALPSRILTGPKLPFNPPTANPNQLIQSLGLIKFDQSDFGTASKKSVDFFVSQVVAAWASLKGFIDNVVGYLAQADTSTPSDIIAMFDDLKLMLVGASTAVDNSVAATQSDIVNLKKKYPSSDASQIVDSLQVWWPGADAVQNSLVCGTEYLKALSTLFDTIQTRVIVLPSNQKFSTVILFQPSAWTAVSEALDNARIKIVNYSS